MSDLQNTENKDNEQLSLNDDRRVRTLSPGALVAQRFFRNRLAVVGMVMLISMFIFSFIGGLISPYRQDEQFYKYTDLKKEYAAVTQNADFRYLSADGQNFDSVAQAKFLLAQGKGETTFETKDATYELTEEGKDFYMISMNGETVAIAFKDIVNKIADLSFDEIHAALIAYTNGEKAFTVGDAEYTLDDDGNILKNGETVGYITRFVISSAQSDVEISREYGEEAAAQIAADAKEFDFVGDDGEEHHYNISYDATAKVWSITEGTETYVYDSYASPSKEHWLGTDTNGMDMLTRLMYGGRVSLIIGFIVVIIEAVLGIILGGISGYFGGWVDNLIMRIVDIFYCIPSLPLIIILGAAMDAMKLDPQIRMLYLMLILGFLGWPSIARLVRGQILSLREQEFMTATEACGIRTSKRIFKHLIPNVIPQLIVICTMSLGSTIITEATLSFLGLGVKFPFASWGNIINDVNNAFVMTHYWFVWIPAGICLLIAVLGFNFVGDGLRDAFDPRMKR